MRPLAGCLPCAGMRYQSQSFDWSAYPVGVCRRLQLAPGKACLVLDVAEGQRRQCTSEGGRAQAHGIGGE